MQTQRAAASTSKRFLALIALLLLCACETARTENYEAALQSWVGRPVADLVGQWGVPDKQFDVDRNTRLIAYRSSRIITYPGMQPSCTAHLDPNGFPMSRCIGAIPPAFDTATCETTFTVVKEKVVSWKHMGNDCRL